MRILLLLYFAYILIPSDACLVSCIIDWVREKLDHTIDIARNPDSIIATLLLEDIKGLNGKRYEVKDRFKVTSVKDDGKVLWKASGGDKCILITVLLKAKYNGLLVLRVWNEGKERFKSFENVNGEWKDVGEDDFTKRYKAMIGEERLPTLFGNSLGPEDNGGSIVASLVRYSDTSSIDLSNPDSSICKLFSVSIEEVPAKTFVFPSTVTIKRIVYGGKIAWEAMNSEFCFYCTTFLRNNMPDIILVRIKRNNDIFQVFINLKKTFLRNRTNYKDKIDELKTHREVVKKFTIDLSADKDGEKCQVTRENRDGLTTFIYTPNNGYFIGKIIDGATTIGQLRDGYACYLCESYSRNDITLLRLHIENGYELSMACYRKDGDNWTGITGDDLSKELIKWSSTECLAINAVPHNRHNAVCRPKDSPGQFCLPCMG